MKVHYTDKGFDVPLLEDEAILVTLWSRETHVMELPPLAPADAESAASFRARALHPGSIDEVLICPRVVTASRASAAMVHIVARDPVGSIASARSVLVPQDFSFLSSSRRERLDLYLTPDWLEWMHFSEGLPKASGSGEWERPYSDLVKQFALPEAPACSIWCPEGMSEDAHWLSRMLAPRYKACGIRFYESHAASVIAHGANSFGRRKDVQKRRKMAFAGLFVLVDIMLAISLGSMDLGALQGHIRELKGEQQRLTRVMSEAAAVKARIAAYGEVKEGAKDPTPYSVIEGLARALPKDCIMTSVQVEGAVFRVSGISADAFALVPALGGGGFSDLTLEQALPLQGTRRSSFTISGKYSP
ncbi:MAG TPA: hypothetical protein VMV83_01380 [Rectinemataceae bacterium]|nr:hypothetical protein [Rectinemataceae bacterium]